MNVIEFLWNVTRFGGTHVIIPASIGVTLGLWRMDEKQVARAFLSGALFCFFWIVLSKIVLLTLGDFSPSGHTAIATFFYASVAFLAVSFRPSMLTAGFAMGLALLIALIGVSRFTVAGHTQLEVAAGLVCGLLSFEVFRRQGPLRADAVALSRGLPIALIAAIILNRLMSFGFLDEEDIRGLSQWLQGELFGA